MTSRIGTAYTMPRAIFIWPFTRAVDLLYDRIGLCKVLDLLNSSNKVAQTLKRVTSLAFCNLIGLPRSWRTNLKRYRQSPRPSLRVFILKELNAVEGAVWSRLRYSRVFCCLQAVALTSLMTFDPRCALDLLDLSPSLSVT